MASYLKMPKLSDTMSEGKIAKWNISEGDEIEMGTEIADIETDKATMAWESSVDGIVHKIYVAEGGAAVLGAPLVLVLEEGEDPPADADNPPGPEKKEEASASDSKSDKETPAKKTTPVKRSKKADRPSTSSLNVKASPLARKVASERGVDLSTVRGSGPG
ncbi:MAG: E3 binding domain-containing protein, partial [Verrucomicrobiales bacterium]|nr:E3 binding domain-containing protein [Verrucomicrobiales bacterium]